MTATIEVDTLRALVDVGNVAVLSGAGLSTDSGIPDYRGPSGSLRRHAPMQYATFVTDPAARHRYWARSYLGWRSIATARPNAGHRAVAALQMAGRLCGIVTQNVDGLHQGGGAVDVIELHGGLDRVVCLDCGTRESRFAIDARLRAANPGFDAHVAAINPDGDADLADADLAGFRMVACCRCNRDMVKPDVVFFGESVPKDRVTACFELVENASALLVLGSSLTVMSGFRFVRRAAALGVPVGIVNQGPTRGDELASVRIDAALGDVLPSLI
ncbi:MAG TPA: NAD-dependent protein deacetylase [Jatrophihabitantaceae bacterium]|nr:NAD-dependent protein deacetylase [Jatrophihabitantaceae bacterium]